MDLSRLAVYVNLLGINEVSALTGVSQTTLKKALADKLIIKPTSSAKNKKMIRREIAQVTSAISDLDMMADSVFPATEADNKGTFDYDFTLDEVDQFTDKVDLTRRLVDDYDNFAKIRDVVAYDKDLDLNTFEQGMQVFGDLTRSQMARITSALADGELDLTEGFDAYFRDGMDIFDDVEDSEFWNWFRELYDDG